jgi:CzcA family heavy metal efflux pump
MNSLIRFSLTHPWCVLGLAIAALAAGVDSVLTLPVDIFPALTRPRVVVMAECAGLAPEEIETLVTIPIETALQGATGVTAVRSQSSVGFAILYAEFDWGANIYLARQIVNERLALVADRLPPRVRPELAPISSIMGQIVVAGMYTEDARTTPLELRTYADWVIRPRLLTIPGVAQVIVIGGGKRQYQVHVHPDELLHYGVTIADVEQALRESNENTSGGFIERGSQEWLIRSLGRAMTKEEIAKTVVSPNPKRSVLVNDVATVVEGAQQKRGDAAINGVRGVALTIMKQPQADTLKVTAAVRQLLAEMESSLPPGVKIEPSLYEQKAFIDLGIANVEESLFHGTILIVLVLIPFLMNVRSTMITMTAIPLSIAISLIVFRLFGLSINVMTLGGFAVAMGELVDDAIVDVENVLRRLRLNAVAEQPQPILKVIYLASTEIRSSLVYGTLLVVLVFVPLFALSGLEGRLFAPLGVAYIVSILASLLVSVTVTPVMASMLLAGEGKGGGARNGHGHDGWLLKRLKGLFEPLVRLSCYRRAQPVLLVLTATAIVWAGVVYSQMGANFLPPFDERAVQVNVMLPPGSSLEASNRVAAIVDDRFAKLLASEAAPLGLIQSMVRRTGRGEQDEHAEGVQHSEYILAINPLCPLHRREILQALRTELETVPGIEFEVEQPLSHLMSHMLSGVAAQIAIKVYGDDLNTLRMKAREVAEAIADVPGIAPPVVEPQQLIPQYRIEVDRSKLALYGLTPADVNRFVQTALQGQFVSQMLDGNRTFDLIVRLDDASRFNVAGFDRLVLLTPTGVRLPLGSIAKLYEGAGPNTIQREQMRRRITVRVNTTTSDLGTAVAAIDRRIQSQVELPTGYFVQLGGQFEAQQAATQRMMILGACSLVGIFVVLYSLFPSTRVVLQIMLAIPIAYVGGLTALWLTGQSLSVASMVGFVSLAGISARNGIMLVSHYVHLMKDEGESFGLTMVIRGSLERLAPVLMTAITAGMGLVPLVLAGQEPGREILYPVATVILGGLISSTCCEYLIHPGLFLNFSGPSVDRLLSTSEPALQLD